MTQARPVRDRGSNCAPGSFTDAALARALALPENYDQTVAFSRLVNALVTTRPADFFRHYAELSKLVAAQHCVGAAASHLASLGGALHWQAVGRGSGSNPAGIVHPSGGNCRNPERPEIRGSFQMKVSLLAVVAFLLSLGAGKFLMSRFGGGGKSGFHSGVHTGHGIGTSQAHRVCGVTCSGCWCFPGGTGPHRVGEENVIVGTCAVSGGLQVGGGLREV